MDKLTLFTYYDSNNQLCMVIEEPVDTYHYKMSAVVSRDILKRQLVLAN